MTALCWTSGQSQGSRQGHCLQVQKLEQELQRLRSLLDRLDDLKMRAASIE